MTGCNHQRLHECVSISEIRWRTSFHFLAHRATDVRTSIEIRRPRRGARNGADDSLSFSLFPSYPLVSFPRVRGISVAACLAGYVSWFPVGAISPKLIAIRPRERGPRRACAREGGGGIRVKEDSFAACANWLAISLRERTSPRHRHSSRLPPSQWSLSVLPVPRHDVETRRCTVRVHRRANRPSEFTQLLFPSIYSLPPVIARLISSR